MFIKVSGKVSFVNEYSIGTVVRAKYSVDNTEYITQRLIEECNLSIGDAIDVSVNSEYPWDACIVLEGE